MNTLHHQYTYNIRWSIIESIIFQGFLFAHQYLLFSVTDAHFYGITGTLFGGAYFLVKFFDLGLNKTLVSYYNDYATNAHSLNIFLQKQLLPTGIAYIITIGSFFFLRYFCTQSIPFFSSCDFFLLSIIALFIATESIKALAKKLLQLSHHFRYVALCEIGFIVCYQSIIWSYYFFTRQLTLPFIFGVCAVMSLCEVIGLLFFVFRWRAMLPSRPLAEHSQVALPSAIIIYNRVFSFTHAMGKQVFSANILVPLFAYLFGFECAALLKLVSYLTHSISSVIEKIIDPTSSALFVHSKNETWEKKQEFFSMASHVSYHLVICILIFLVINSAKLLSISTVSLATLSYLILYFLIHYFENFFIIVERFYVAHGRSEFLLISTGINCLLGGVVLLYALSPITALLLLFFSRLVSLGLLLFCLSYLWGIKHSVALKPRYIVGSLVTSLLFFILF
jgi:hypothetical protein